MQVGQQTEKPKSCCVFNGARSTGQENTAEEESRAFQEQFPSRNAYLCTVCEHRGAHCIVSHVVTEMQVEVCITETHVASGVSMKLVSAIITFILLLSSLYGLLGLFHCLCMDTKQLIQSHFGDVFLSSLSHLDTDRYKDKK